MSAKSIKALGFRLTTAAVGFAFAFVVAEVVVRLFVPKQYWRYQDATSDWQLDPRLGWVQMPNLDVTTQMVDRGWIVHFQTNEDGLTPGTARRARDPRVIRIMIFGDSSVVGRGVPQDQTINAHLERLLRAQGVSAEVINAGVQGYSTDQVLLRIQQLVPLYHPDIIVYGLHINDFGGNATRSAYGGISKPVFLVKKNGDLAELAPDLKKSKISPFACGINRLIQSSAVYRFFYPETLKLRAYFMGWEYRNLIGFAPEPYYRPEELARFDWQLFTALLKRMDSCAREHRARFFFYAIPMPAEVWDPFIRDIEQEAHLPPGQYDRYALEKVLVQVAKKNGVMFCPMIDYFMANQARAPFHLLPYDFHNNATGYQVAAEVIGQFLLSSNLLTTSPQVVETKKRENGA